ncbi:AarF/ABC1/UbiB kinase family protein, partial [Salmonella enterica subsp. enterica serovar Virchow]|nr:AarF/ABC1/UbiB kinase family protein [Salmonella enterica subsp. enterica serovar Virchow]
QRFVGDRRYVVPRILKAYSTDRLLCMTYEDGVSILDEQVFALPQERRNAIGQASIEIMLREIFEWGDMQTDPNFGNYLIRLAQKPNTQQPDTQLDQLVLLDFGAIRQFDDNLLLIARNLLLAGVFHDRSKMRQAIDQAGKHFEFFANLSD